MIGVTAKSVEMTADYVKERVQFDRAIATFQAVAQRAADARIDSAPSGSPPGRRPCVSTTASRRRRLPRLAKFWAAEGGQRIVHAATHLHGGVGVDRDYPLHRYYLWTKKQELFLGGMSPSLLRLGRLLADEPVPG